MVLQLSFIARYWKHKEAHKNKIVDKEGQDTVGGNQICFLNFAAHATQKKSVYVLYTKNILFKEY